MKTQGNKNAILAALLAIITLALGGCSLLKPASVNENSSNQPEATQPPAITPKSQQSQPTHDVSSPKTISATVMGVRSDSSSQVIQVKFREGSDLDQPLSLLPTELRGSVKSIARSFTLTKQEINKVDPNLNRWFKLTLTPGTNALVFIEAMRQLASVEVAELAPRPAPPPAPPP